MEDNRPAMNEKYPLATIQQAKEYLFVESLKTFASLIPDEQDRYHFIQVAALHNLRKNQKLLKCTRESFRNCLVEAAHLDLVPGGILQHCYLIPYGTQCTLQVGYRGLVQIAERDGRLRGVWAHVVYEDEVKAGKFVVEEGTKHSIHHERDPFRKETTDGVVGAYACFRLPSGDVEHDIMGLDRIMEAKKKSRGSDEPESAWNGPFVLEMYKKCPIKRGAKRIPQLRSDAWQRVLQLEERDGVPRDSKREVRGEVIDVREEAEEPIKTTAEPVTSDGEKVTVIEESFLDESPDAQSDQREEINKRIVDNWEVWVQLIPDERELQTAMTDRLAMDRSLADYMNPGFTSDSDASAFSMRLIRDRMRLEREKKHGRRR